MLINRINWHLYHSNQMSPNQYGFRQGKSTTDAAMQVKTFIKSAWENNKHAVIVSIDFRKAFDHPWWPKVLSRLKETKCPMNIYNLTQSYLTNRKVVFQSGNINISRQIDRGCPQGSRCGPGLWNLVFDDILNSFDSTKDAKLQAFADDLLLMVAHRNCDRLAEQMNNHLQYIYEWSHKNKQPINYDKCRALVGTRLNKGSRLQRTICIYIGDKKVKVERELKYLGILFDERLNWQHHVTMICQKSIQQAHALKWITGKHWDVNSRNRKIIYKAAMEPAILYAIPVWHEALDKTHIRRRLLSVQRKFAIQICKAYRTAPTSVLLVLAGILPIHIEGRATAWRWLISKGINMTQISKNIPDKDKEDTDRGILDITNYIQNHGLDITTTSTENYSHPHDEQTYTLNLTFEQSTNIGATWKIFTGAGIVVMNREGKTRFQAYLKMAPHCTNVQAEQWAIVKAIKHIQDNIHMYKGSIEFYTDSQTSLNIHKNRKKHTGLSLDLIKTANELGRIRKIHFNWIPAHQGHSGNDLADKLAKKACQLNGEPTFTKIPRTWLKNQLTKLGNNMWQQEWDTVQTGRKTYAFIPSINSRLTTRHYTPDAETTQCLTGHGNFAAYLNRFGIQTTSTCDCDNTSEGDSDHLLYYCPKYENERLSFIRKCITNGVNWPPNPKDIFNNKEVWQGHKNFVHKTKALCNTYSNETIS
ncbi:uncharacterized protein [Centruroides vittatus]|uniref:uncharacterized protein n=1 Tax=Centruroides vittatus TaxID=120091 RepID=UPI00350FF006